MNRKYIVSILLFIVAFVVAAYQGIVARPAETVDQEPSEAETSEIDFEEEDVEEEEDQWTLDTNAIITKVVDGDTVDVVFNEGYEARIRLLGVNTPETVDPRRTVECFGKEASNFAKETLAGERVLLVADPQADERDRYGRLLRNIYLEDGTDFNAMLIEQGYAYAYLSFPLTPERKAELKRLETEAKEAQRGLWDPDACQSDE
jgi:micrococcal nuclease